MDCLPKRVSSAANWAKCVACLFVVSGLSVVVAGQASQSPEKPAVSDNSDAMHVNRLKWHPGHYALFWQSPSDELLQQTVFASPYLSGAQIVYSWDKLEPEKDRYDFSAIEKDLARLQRHGKFLWAQIQRQGSGSPPAYLNSFVEKRKEVLAVLEMPVMERYAKLFRELGKRFDGEPGFTAINSTESIGDYKRRDGEEEFVRAWTYFHENCRKTFTNTVVISYITWGPGKEKVRRDLVKYGVGVGSPDTVPSADIAPYNPGPPPRGTNPGHTSEPIYTDHDYLAGKVPICMAVQKPELMKWHRRHGTFTLDEIYRMAVDRLHANYLSWDVESRSEEIRHGFVEDIMPFLAAKKGRINTDIPSALAEKPFSNSTINPAATYCAFPAADLEPAARTREEPHDAFFNVLADYRDYYAQYEPLCFTAITPDTSDAFGLRMTFDSNMPAFSHVEYADEGEDFRILAGNAVFLSFDAGADAAQDKTFRVRPVFSAPSKAVVYTIHVNWMTRKAFAKAGGFRKTDIVKVSCEPPMSFGTNSPEAWKTYKPTEADIAFARKQWGHLLEGVTSDYEKAKILTKALMRELGPHGGLPQAFLYDLPAFEKYLAITSGKSGHACAQYSEIFSMACNCFGVINRWGFLNDGLQNDEVLIELGTSHLVTEIFDRQLNQWIFI
ncbi:MAG: hypothetical protein ACOY3P_02245, partial [Planctomycetota bacterium]